MLKLAKTLGRSKFYQQINCTRKQIFAFADKELKRDYYEVLGLPETATQY